MEARRLTPEERFEAELISTLAFHMRIDDPEKARQESVKAAPEDWGAFAEDGTMAGRIINHRFESYLDGQLIVNGGIGAVSTLPEYRNAGAIRAIFERLLPQAYRDGQVISTLYPFSHAFYRKFGYETACWKSVYAFAPGVLREYGFTGRAVQWKPGDPAGEYAALYDRFASGFNLAIRRDEDRMLKHLQGEWYKDRKFCYMLYEGEKPVAYLIFQDVRRDPAALLSVQDLAWEGRAGLRAILGFLARFSADYGRIELFLPNCVELFSVLHSPQAYDIEKSTHQDYMIRVVNARRLLACIKKPADRAFTIGVTDPLIEENNGVWRVHGDAVEAASEAPDLRVSVQALGQLAAGCVSLAEAAYRDDVEILNNRETLERVFVRKPVFVAEHF